MSDGDGLAVTVWNEGVVERELQEAREAYPEGMAAPIAAHLESLGHDVRTATLGDPEHGLSADALAETDVLTWWGHRAHDEVPDDVADRVVERVLDGMGFLPLHSAHYSKPFTRLMGTTCSLKWREAGERERLWAVEPGHPIADGVDEYLELPEAEMYGERFDVPQPDALVFVSWFEGGEVFRSGCCYRRGRGRIFYFRPGHETYPIYRDDEVLGVLGDAVEWAAGGGDGRSEPGNRDPIEPLD